MCVCVCACACAVLELAETMGLIELIGLRSVFQGHYAVEGALKLPVYLKFHQKTTA